MDNGGRRMGNGGLRDGGGESWENGENSRGGGGESWENGGDSRLLRGLTGAAAEGTNGRTEGTRGC